jgi:flavodoxin
MNVSNNIAIIFFSKDGSTRLAAKLLTEKTRGKVTELKEKRKGGVLKAILKMGSKLTGEPWLEIKNAQKVYLMLPIWASNGVPAMNTFIKKADFTGKEVCIITVQADTEFKGSKEVHDYIGGIVRSNGGIYESSYSLLGAGMNKCASEDAIKEQIKKIELI